MVKDRFWRVAVIVIGTLLVLNLVNSVFFESNEAFGTNGNQYMVLNLGANTNEDMTKRLNAAAAEGWELVTVSGSSYTTYAFMKK